LALDPSSAIRGCVVITARAAPAAALRRIREVFRIVAIFPSSRGRPAIHSYQKSDPASPFRCPVGSWLRPHRARERDRGIVALRAGRAVARRDRDSSRAR
jgi:hypothetical protein